MELFVGFLHYCTNWRDHDDKTPKHHHDSRQHNDGDGDKKHSTRIIIIDKHSSSNTKSKKDVNKNDETNKKEEDALFGERAGEIHRRRQDLYRITPYTILWQFQYMV